MNVPELKEFFQAIMHERDRRYAQRFRELERFFQNSLRALEKQTSEAFGASDKAVAKADAAQKWMIGALITLVGFGVSVVVAYLMRRP